MKTMKEFHEMLQNDRNALFAKKNELSAALNTLQKIHHDVRCFGSDDPRDTVSRFVESVGTKTAKEVVFSCVNARNFDDRISRDVREAAESSTEAWDYETAVTRMGLYADDIHSCHLDQIAKEIMKY